MGMALIYSKHPKQVLTANIYPNKTLLEKRFPITINYSIYKAHFFTIVFAQS